MIRAVVESPIPVGGIAHGVDKLALLSPWIAVVAIAAFAIRRRKR